MKREIKFRAWHKNQKEMFTSLYLTFGGKIGMWNYEETETDFSSDYSYLELMQFTGLKDKNGKDIYEGDILASSNDGNDGCDIWDIKDHGYTLIFWDQAHCQFTGSTWMINRIRQQSVYDYEYVEVIGNIYENPELL